MREPDLYLSPLSTLLIDQSLFLGHIWKWGSFGGGGSLQQRKFPKGLILEGHLPLPLPEAGH